MILHGLDALVELLAIFQSNILIEICWLQPNVCDQDKNRAHINIHASNVNVLY